MKKNLLIAATGWLFCTFIAQAANLTVTVSGIKNRPHKEGNILIFLYDNSSNYMNPEKGQIVTLKSEGETIEYTFTDLKEGEYAVILHHDADADGKMKSILGIPREGFGFSNNIRPTVKAPSFNQVKLTVSGNTATHIKMIYL